MTCRCCSCQHSRNHTHEGCTACWPDKSVADPKDPKHLWNRIQEWLNSWSFTDSRRRHPEWGSDQPEGHAPHKGFGCPPQNMPPCPGFEPRTSEPEDDLDTYGSLDEPCPHPARNGIHEVYVAPGGKGQYCRACGANKGIPKRTMGKLLGIKPPPRPKATLLDKVRRAIKTHQKATPEPRPADEALWKTIERLRY